MNVEECHQYILECRGVRDPCPTCAGLGVTTYATTGTWRTGVGGSTITTDVCNKCWGSGDANRPWPSHRLLLRLHNEKTASDSTTDTDPNPKQG